jgi:sulfate transport system ATP-binding protein
MAIAVRAVSKRFGTAVALDQVDLDVADGSLTALLGPSGGGKSTLLRVVAGLEIPDEGTVSIGGTDVTQQPPQRRGVGFCFQHYAAFRHMTVAGNVAFGLKVRHRPRAEIRARVAELLDLVRLGDLAGRYPAQLSGGQRQRMALARALAVEPMVLLLDEPFGSLDAQVRRELRAWLRRLHDEVAVTTVLVTHDQEEAMDVADQIAVINNGRIEQAGTPSRLYDAPASEFVLTFLGPATFVDGRWVRPHDLRLHHEQTGGQSGVRARVDRVAYLGFEVRVELTTGSDPAYAQLSRADAARLGLRPGDPVWVTVAEQQGPGAPTGPAGYAPAGASAS